MLSFKRRKTGKQVVTVHCVQGLKQSRSSQHPICLPVEGLFSAGTRLSNRQAQGIMQEIRQATVGPWTSGAIQKFTLDAPRTSSSEVQDGRRSLTTDAY